MGKRRAPTLTSELEVAASGGEVARLEAMLQQALPRLSQQQKHALYRGIKKKYHGGVDLGYLRTVIFPELYSYDIPQPLVNLSYCRFTDRQDATINVMSGSGVIIWYPKTTTGPSVFYYPQPTSSSIAQGAFVGTTLPTTTPLKHPDSKNCFAGFCQSYASCFSQASLVSASISVQYIGQLDQESGMMVGGHIHGQSLNELIVDDIENSQFVTRGRPSEGLRFVYLPMDAQDYEYNQLGWDYSGNQGTYNPQGLSSAAANAKFNVRVTTDGLINDSANIKYIGDVGWSGDPGTLSGAFGSASATRVPIPPTVAQDNLAYTSGGSYIAIYFTGLPPDSGSGTSAYKASKCLRIDVTRKFNGVPRQAYRDLVEVTRPKRNYDSKKTFDALRNLCMNAPVGGHTLKDLEKHQESIQTHLPNIVNEGFGELEQVSTLGELAQTLEQSNAYKKGLMGPTTGTINRIYPFSV